MKYIIEIAWGKSETYKSGRVIRTYKFLPSVGMELFIERKDKDDDIQLNKADTTADYENVLAESICGVVKKIIFYEKSQEMWDNGEGCEFAPFYIELEPEE
jgi:hypothetical protein